MRIKKATKKYEAWLAKNITIVPADLALKHTRMAEDPFQFLRATFYRWVQVWPQVCPDLARAPRVLAVGDLHVENFGTWRDQEGRLIWGVNDFDEAYPMPYTNRPGAVGGQRPPGDFRQPPRPRRMRMRARPSWQGIGRGWKPAASLLCWKRITSGCARQQPVSCGTPSISGER